MTETTVNIPLLRKAVEWAEAEAAKGYAHSEWFQPMWDISPQAIRLNGITALTTGAGSIEATKAPECGTCYCIAGYVTHALGGDREVSEQFARDALGLNDKESGSLFLASNTIADVREIAESIAGERL